MATIHDLGRSITEMSFPEVVAHIVAIRESRRTKKISPKKMKSAKIKAKKTAEKAKEKIDKTRNKLSNQQQLELLQMLEKELEQ